MAIRLLQCREKDAATVDLIRDAIDIGMECMKVVSQSKFYRSRRINERVSAIIKDCNNFLGMGGNFKNGCLYREKGLQEFWSRGNGEMVVCDHAIPVTELVQRYHSGEPIERLIFSPVVRIKKESNDILTGKGYAKSGYIEGFPLSRYSRIGMSVVNHFGEVVDPSEWTDEDHWKLINRTEELKELIGALAINHSPSDL